VDSDESPDNHSPGWVPILEWCRMSSKAARSAFIDIEMHGGSGPRAAAAYVDGRVVMDLQPLPELAEGPDPVAEALRAIGVARLPEKHDEFATLGLERHRTTGAWLDEIGYR